LDRDSEAGFQDVPAEPNSQGQGSNWYAVQTGYRCEHRVALGLTSKGFETYLPVLREVHQWTDRKKVVDTPAFSGYLFVRYAPSLRNRVQVLETNGVVRLLGGNHTPNQVPDDEIDLVLVKRGPLAGVRGRIVRIKNSLRLVVAVSVFSQAIAAELGLQDVEGIASFT
jgi:transcription antitermination factor NusG